MVGWTSKYLAHPEYRSPMLLSMFKISAAIVALLLAGLLGMACSNSGLRSTAHDAGAASAGHAGSTISSGTASGTGGTIGSGGAGAASIGGAGGTIASGGSTGTGGTAGSSGAGGTGGQGPMCALYPMCNPGDQQMGMDCPAERECYTLSVSCGSGQDNTTTCVLPVGVHCDDPLLCNPGDTETTFGDQGWIGCADPHSCYQLNLCAYFIMCKYGEDAGVDAGASDTRVDAGTRDAGVDERATPHCGDGILQTSLGEECDMGPQNGLQPDGGGCPFCSTDCMVPLCVL
jgi:hypothetical protein